MNIKVSNNLESRPNANKSNLEVNTTKPSFKSNVYEDDNSKNYQSKPK